MIWQVSDRADPMAAALADRHYSRKHVGATQFAPPGRCLVLYAKTDTGQALWVSSWQKPQYVHHPFPGAWMCSMFRNESAGVASQMIREAVAATVAVFGGAPAAGMVTLVNPRKVAPTLVRGVPTWGRVFELAGFKVCGSTSRGLLWLRLDPADMPDADPPIRYQANLFNAGQPWR